MVTMEVDKSKKAHISSPIIHPQTSADEVHYSRLIHTMGKGGVEKLQQSRALILGCKGLGAEIAKNLVLSGIRGVGLVDDGIVLVGDLGSNMLLREDDVGSSRAAATAKNLSELNLNVEVVTLSDSMVESNLHCYQVVIATKGPFTYLEHVNHLCRLANVYFVATVSRGVFGFTFVDLGKDFCVIDQTGELARPVLVESITQDFPATITVVEEQRHGLEDGDQVVFSGIMGMQEVNDRAYSVTVTGTASFTIPEDTRGFQRYGSGGYFRKSRPPKHIEFLPLDRALFLPEFCIYDPLKASRLPHLHVAFQAIDEFERRRKPSLLDSIHDHDMCELLQLARNLWCSFKDMNRLRAFGNSKTEFDKLYDLGSKSSFEDGQPSRHDDTDEACSDGVLDGQGSISSDHCQRHEGSSSSISNGIAENSEEIGGWQASDVNEEIVRSLAQAASIELCPVAAIMGGFTAQEVMKAISGVFMPLHQWFYFDAAECLPAKLPSLEERASKGSRYGPQTTVFGKDFQNRLESTEWLVVGAGGIGSEVLKNLSLMGAGCSPSGKIVVTDMDIVSKANLPTQVLFRMDDIGRPKTPCAARAMRKINPAARVLALQEKFGPESEQIFDSSFFEGLTGVFSAVDTSSSRLYMDMRCVFYRRPMIDGGKHGTKGSVQVFVPFKSEMYASTRDAPEHKEVPICTLKNFPYATEHALQWAVETFEALFKQRPLDVNSYLSSREFQDSLKKASSSQLPILETLCDALVRQRPLSFDACVQWARFQFEELFSNSIKQLLFNFPPGMVTTAGAPFWSGTKRIPSPLIFQASNPLHMDFVIAAANLQATVYGLKGCRDPTFFMDILGSMAIPHFEPKEGVKIATTDNELRTSAQRRGRANGDDNDIAYACESMLKDLPAPSMLVGYRLTPIEFEKDDESNFHVEFVAAAANLRAYNYGIPLADKLQARLIGGRAVPAIVTSASVIGGMMCLEVYKLLQEKALEDYRHSYFNLSVPLFCSAQPTKAAEHIVPRAVGGPLTWTLWDRFEMDCNGVTLEGFLSEFRLQQGLEITMMSHGKSLLYAEFLPLKKRQDRMQLTLLDLVTTVGKVVIPTNESKITFSITCTDESGDDIEVPDVVAKDCLGGLCFCVCKQECCNTRHAVRRHGFSLLES